MCFSPFKRDNRVKIFGFAAKVFDVKTNRLLAHVWLSVTVCPTPMNSSWTPHAAARLFALGLHFSPPPPTLSRWSPLQNVTLSGKMTSQNVTWRRIGFCRLEWCRLTPSLITFSWIFRSSGTFWTASADLIVAMDGWRKWNVFCVCVCGEKKTPQRRRRLSRYTIKCLSWKILRW